MLEYAGKGTFEGKRVAISGSGNVAQFAALKCLELGATVVSLSDSQGCLIAEGDGITEDQINAIADLKAKRQSLNSFDSHGNLKYIEGSRPWTHVGKVDVVLPCATQNEVSQEEAEALISAGAIAIAEGSNMGCTQEAIDLFESQRQRKGREAIWYGPGKAANCGGVAVSGLEMAQNSQVSLGAAVVSLPTADKSYVALDMVIGRGGREAQRHNEECVRECAGYGKGIRRDK
jgi:glutamate dehydrogenase (NADP+)